MAATAALVPVRARRPPVAIPALQHLPNALQARHDLLAQGRQHHIIARALERHRVRQRERGRRRREEVEYLLVVDLQVRAPQEVLPRRGAPDEGEHVLHRARDDARLGVAPAQRERLARGGLAVREDDGVVPVHGGGDVRARGGGVDGLVCGPGEDGIVCVRGRRRASALRVCRKEFKGMFVVVD